MADAKISALTGATTPLAGTEVLPIVQSGATVKVSVANLTAGRALSATQMTLTTGNLIVANAQGIDFSATPGTGTSELFNDYEEGAWTPTDLSGAGLVFTVSNNRYTKIGRSVTCSAVIVFPVTASAATADIGGFPFVAGAYAAGPLPVIFGGGGFITMAATTSEVVARDINSNVITNATLSTKTIVIAITYQV